MENYQPLAIIKGHTGNIYALLELPQEILVSGGYDKSIMFWNMRDDNSLVKTIKGEN